MACCVCCPQGLDDELLARLPEWRFACDRVWLHADMDLEAHHHPAALRNTLRQMSTTTWHATETSVCGKNSVLYSFLWKWTPDMLRHYAEAIPALKELGLARHEPEMGVLTDDLLSACIEVSGMRSRVLVCVNDRISIPWCASVPRCTCLCRPGRNDACCAM